MSDLSDLVGRKADSVRVELIMGDITYTIELAAPGGIEAALDIDLDTSTEANHTSGWMETKPTGYATVGLRAFGRLVKSERREKSPPKPRRPPGGRPPMPGMDAACTRCGRPRGEHGGPKQMGACPGETGLRAKRFAIAPQHGQTGGMSR